MTVGRDECEIMNRATELEYAVENLLSIMNMSYQRVSNYRCFKCGQVQNSKSKGWPDFFVYHPRLLAIECKTGTGKLTKEQKEIAEKLSEMGIKYLIVRDTVDTLIIHFKELGLIN